MSVFTKQNVGVVVPSGERPTEQTLKILEFATSNGYGLSQAELELAKTDYQDSLNELTDDWFEALAEELDCAVAYLESLCDNGVTFRFDGDDNFVIMERV